MHQHSHQRSWSLWNSKWQNVNDLLWFHWNWWRKCLLHRFREFFMGAREADLKKKRFLPKEFAHYADSCWIVPWHWYNDSRSTFTEKKPQRNKWTNFKSLDIKLEIHSVQISSRLIQIAQPSNWNWNNKLNFSFHFYVKRSPRAQFVIIFIFISHWNLDMRSCERSDAAVATTSGLVSSKCFFFCFSYIFSAKNQRTSVGANCITCSAASIQKQRGKNTHTSYPPTLLVCWICNRFSGSAFRLNDGKPNTAIFLFTDILA